MGKATMKRKKNRHKYLAKLAEENPVKFHSEWSKRLESWSREAEKRACHIIDRNGIPVPSTFDLIDRALNELKACGEKAFMLEEDKTRETMLDACAMAVSKVIDHRIYHVTNAH